VNTEELFKELNTFCKNKGLEEREAAYLLGLFTKHISALRQLPVSDSLLKDWQMWEDCMLSFLRSHTGLRAKFNEHVDEWNTQIKLPPSAYEREEQ